MAGSYCVNCGKQIDSNASFCTFCGYNQQNISRTANTQNIQSRPEVSNTYNVQSRPEVSSTYNVQNRPEVSNIYNVQSRPRVSDTYNIKNTKEKNKKKAGWRVTGIIVAILLIVAITGGAVYFIINGKNGSATNIPDVKYSFMDETLKPTVSCNAVEAIYPALYNAMDYVIVFEGSCEQGDTDVLVEVEIPGFTEKYSQKFTLNRQLTQIYVKPSISASKEELSSQKNAQINFTVTDIETNKVISKDTKSVSIMSLYDFNLNESLRYNAWAWLTPENKSVKELKQKAVECLPELTDGALNSIISYQGSEDTMYYECLSMVVAASRMGIRYNDSGYSSSKSGDYLQRVAFPEEVIASKSGICIETSLLIASALQSAGYNCMLVFTTGHCQVAVEVGDCTGEYYIIETTCLPADGLNATDIVWYYTKDEWKKYLDNNDGICIPCNLATNYGFTPIYN